MDSTIMQLILMMNNHPHDDAEHHLAASILRNFYEVPSLSIEEMAERCYTSSATLSRFCKRLGFKNYVVFRNTFEPKIKQLKQERYIYSGFNAGPTSSTAQRYIEQTINTLINIQHQLDPAELAAATEAIHRANHILLIGTSTLLPTVIDFQYRMLLCERFVHYSPTWVHASEMEQNSVRILPEIVLARGKNSNGQVELSTVERLSPANGNLVDVHISIQESIPFVTSERNRFIHDGETSKIALMCTMGILHSAYMERYIRELNR